MPKLSIIVVSTWYNEAFLAPFFLNHYAYVDKIHLIIDTDTNDKTHEICARYPNIEIEDITMPDGNDCSILVTSINQCVSRLDCDWVYVVDADEFIFPKNMENPRDVLARQTGSLMKASMWNIYRHVTEPDLDPNKLPVEQRRHGNPALNLLFTKPIIAKPETGISWSVGNHFYESNDKIVESKESFIGVHWTWADVNMAIERKLKGRRDRMSQVNKQNMWGWEYFEMTEESIRAECKVHENDPRLF